MKFEFSAIVVYFSNWTVLFTSLYKVTLNTEIVENSVNNKQIFKVRP